MPRHINIIVLLVPIILNIIGIYVNTYDCTNDCTMFIIDCTMFIINIIGFFIGLFTVSLIIYNCLIMFLIKTSLKSVR